MKIKNVFFLLILGLVGCGPEKQTKENAAVSDEMNAAIVNLEQAATSLQVATKNYHDLITAQQAAAEKAAAAERATAAERAERAEKAEKAEKAVSGTPKKNKAKEIKVLFGDYFQSELSRLYPMQEWKKDNDANETTMKGMYSEGWSVAHIVKTNEHAARVQVLILFER